MASDNSRNPSGLAARHISLSPADAGLAHELAAAGLAGDDIDAVGVAREVEQAHLLGIADQMEHRFEHAPLVRGIGLRRHGHDDGLRLVDIVSGVGPAVQRRPQETHELIVAARVAQRRSVDVEAVLQEAEPDVGEAHVQQIAGRGAGVQDRPVFVVHHCRGAGDAPLDQVGAVRPLLHDADAIGRDLDAPEPVADIELIADIPDPEALAGDVADAMNAGVAPAHDRHARLLEDLRDVDDVLPAHAGVDGGREPGERHVGFAFGQHVDRVDAGAAFDQFDAQPLALIEAFLNRRIDAGELCLVLPHQLKANASIFLCGARRNQKRRHDESEGRQRLATLNERSDHGHVVAPTAVRPRPA